MQLTHSLEIVVWFALQPVANGKHFDLVTSSRIQVSQSQFVICCNCCHRFDIWKITIAFVSHLVKISNNIKLLCHEVVMNVPQIKCGLFYEMKKENKNLNFCSKLWNVLWNFVLKSNVEKEANAVKRMWMSTYQFLDETVNKSFCLSELTMWGIEIQVVAED